MHPWPRKLSTKCRSNSWATPRWDGEVLGASNCFSTQRRRAGKSAKELTPKAPCGAKTPLLAPSTSGSCTAPPSSPSVMSLPSAAILTTKNLPPGCASARETGTISWRWSTRCTSPRTWNQGSTCWAGDGTARRALKCGRLVPTWQSLLASRLSLGIAYPVEVWLLVFVFYFEFSSQNTAWECFWYLTVLLPSSFVMFQLLRNMHWSTMHK